MFLSRFTQVSSFILAPILTLNTYADVTMGSNPTNISTNANLAVEATNGAKVWVDKTTGDL